MARPHPHGATWPPAFCDALLVPCPFLYFRVPYFPVCRAPGALEDLCVHGTVRATIGQSRGPDPGPPAPLWVRVGPLSGSRLCWPIQLFLAEAVENAFIFGRCRYKWAF